MRLMHATTFYWECVLWLLLLLLGLAVAEGPFRISLPKDGFPSDLRILEEKMDATFGLGGEEGGRGSKGGGRPHRK